MIGKYIGYQMAVAYPDPKHNAVDNVLYGDFQGENPDWQEDAVNAYYDGFYRPKWADTQAHNIHTKNPTIRQESLAIIAQMTGAWVSPNVKDDVTFYEDDPKAEEKCKAFCEQINAHSNKGWYCSPKYHWFYDHTSDRPNWYGIGIWVWEADCSAEVAIREVVNLIK